MGVIAARVEASLLTEYHAEKAVAVLLWRAASFCSTKGGSGGSV